MSDTWRAYLEKKLEQEGGKVIMLKNKSLTSQPTFLDNCPLVEKLTDETASTISGGIQIENGTTFVGSSSSRHKDITVDWFNNFTFEPSFVAIAEYQNNRNLAWQDAFSVTILEKNADRALVRIRREDSSSPWGQQLLLSWIAVGT